MRQREFSRNYFRFAMAREPLSRVVSHFYQCKKKNANKQCRVLAMNGPMAFFSSDHQYANNLQSKFLGFNKAQGKEGAVKAANQYDLIVIQERMGESLSMLHFYGVLSVRDLLFLSFKTTSPRRKPLPTRALNTARQHNAADFILWDAIMARHNATLLLFSGLDQAVARWEEAWEQAHERCQQVAQLDTWRAQHRALKETNRKEWQKQYSAVLGAAERCMDEECARWEPCSRNDLALGLQDVGLATDLRGDSKHLRAH
eukprot:3635928-Rhodomonas_salina.1